MHVTQHDPKAIDNNWSWTKISVCIKLDWRKSVLFVWNLSTIRWKSTRVVKWMEEWISNWVQFESGEKLFVSALNHFQSLLLSCIKHFTTKREQTLSHSPEKLWITKAIYQLNKCNKGWLNTNLAEIPTLFTIDRVGQGFWVCSILGFLISGIQYLYA